MLNITKRFANVFLHLDEFSSESALQLWNASMSIQPLQIQSSNVISIACQSKSMINSIAGQRFRCMESIWKPHLPSCVSKICTLQREIRFAQLWTNDTPLHGINQSLDSELYFSSTENVQSSIQLDHDQLLQVRCNAGFKLFGANALRCFFGELSAVFVHKFAQQQIFYRHSNVLQQGDQLWPSCLPRNCTLPALTYGQYDHRQLALGEGESDQFELMHGQSISFQCVDTEKPVTIECDFGILKPMRPACDLLQQDTSVYKPKNANYKKSLDESLSETMKEDEWISSLTAEDRIQLQQLQMIEIKLNRTSIDKKLRSYKNESLTKMKKIDLESTWCRSPHHVQQLVQSWFDPQNVPTGSHLIGFVELPIRLETNRQKEEKIVSSFFKSRMKQHNNFSSSKAKYPPGARLLFRCVLESTAMTLTKLKNVRLEARLNDDSESKASWLLQCTNGSWIGQRVACVEQSKKFQDQLNQLSIQSLQNEPCFLKSDQLFEEKNSNVLVFFHDRQMTVDGKNQLKAGSVITLRCSQLGLYKLIGKKNAFTNFVKMSLNLFFIHIKGAINAHVVGENGLENRQVV